MPLAVLGKNGFFGAKHDDENILAYIEESGKATGDSDFPKPIPLLEYSAKTAGFRLNRNFFKKIKKGLAIIKGLCYYNQALRYSTDIRV